MKARQPRYENGWARKQMLEEADWQDRLAEAYRADADEDTARGHEIVAAVLEAVTLGLLEIPVPREFSDMAMEKLGVFVRIPAIPEWLIGLRKQREGRRYRELRERTPAWADLKAIEAIYGEARRLTESTGVEHVVDHEIPLRGELVSGLHVERNLCVITWDANSAKSNRFEIE